MDALVKTIGAFGMGRIAAMGAVAFGLVGIFAFMMFRFGQPAMVPLYTNLGIEDSAAVVSQLESLSVSYELKQNGATILVPEDRVLRLRLSMAEDGMPVGGIVGYEIFDSSSALGTTSFVQNINRTRALEGELARTIKAIDRVQMARVHLVQPERQLFSRDRAEPSASIVLRVRGQLQAEQIRSIQNLVASAVESLNPSRVSIVDENGRLLASGRDASDGGYLASSLDERNVDYERRLREQITDIISNVVGPGGARVEVAAELDFNRVTQTSDVYDPDGRVVRSTQTREGVSASSEAAADRGVTVANELPNADGTGNDQAGSQENSTTSEEIVNYEISKTTRTEIVEAGRVKRISVAVLIDGVQTVSPDGEATYEPRTADEIDQIAALVRSAIGYSEERGDVVEVVNMRFVDPAAPPPLVDDEALFLGFTRPDVIRMAEIGVLLIVAILVVFVVVRPLVRRIIEPEQFDSAQEKGNTLITGPDGQQVLIGPDGKPTALPAPESGEKEDGEHQSRALEMIEVAQSTGEAQASTVKRVGELVQNNPDEAVAIVRAWMSEPA